MSQLVADCPRCGIKSGAFDALCHVYRGNIGGACFNSFCQCRGCGNTLIFNIRRKSNFGDDPINVPHLNDRFEVQGYQQFTGFRASPPEHLPPAIKKVFEEGAVCLSVKCWNAGATMFRMCLDISTKELLPNPSPAGLTPHIQRNLGPRLGWLIDNNILPESLRELSQCIKDDGNDGAHDGTLTQADTEDLMDFTFILLERLYTEPRRLELARERRVARHAPPTP